MFLAPRSFAFILLAALALVAAGCGSNNKGKIEGKWKFVDIPVSDAKAKEGMDVMGKMGVYLYFDFKPDGNFDMGLGSDKPEALEFIKAMAPGKTINWSAKYKLLSGDGVELYDLPKEMQEQGGVFGKNKDRARTKIKIEGDNMTMTDDDGKTGKLNKVK